MKAIRLFFCLIFILFIAADILHTQVISANGDTIYIPGGTPTGLENAGLLETTINGDTLNGARINPNRVYALNEGQYYIQRKAININNAAGILTIVGIPSTYGNTKPVWVMQGIGGKVVINGGGCNVIYGSLKFENIHYVSQQLDGTLNNENFYCGTKNNLPQSLTINNCLFEFSNIDLFDCTNERGSIGGWPYGAKFIIKNSYFRNLFHAGQWWGSRIFQCKHPIDTMWIENNTITGGGLIFLNQNALTKFAYFNHNTIINNKKYWLKAPYFIELYVCNNIFINQNWSGEDWENTIKHGDDSDTLITSTINIDSVAAGSGVAVQAEYYTPDSSSYTDAINPDKMKVYISNNIHFSDTLLNRYYTTDAYNTLGLNYPLSYLTWFAKNPPFQVINIPCAWMNTRTKEMIAMYPNMVEENTINSDPYLVTPAIKDASVADQMAKWNQCMWADPAYPSSANDIINSAYIFGDYDPNTIPGAESETGGGINKFTELTEDFSQNNFTSTIDGFSIGSLIWNDALNDPYIKINSLALVKAGYNDAVTEAADATSLPLNFELLQNYPNPFNPTTKIDFSLAKASHVRLMVYNVLGQKVMTLVNNRMNAGAQSIVFDAGKLTSGVYFYRLYAGSYSSVKKMVLLK